MAWRDLSTLMHAGMPYPSYFPAPEFTVVSRADGGATPQVTQFSVCTHMGTHVDSPAHFLPGGKTLHDFPLERFMTSAVVWPVDRGAGEAIPASDLVAARPAVAPGEAVLLCTGWGAKWGTPEYGDHPHLSEAAARWLVDQGIGLLGMDVMTPDCPVAARPAGYAHPIHHLLLGADVLIVENMVGLEPLAGRRVELHALPIRLDADDGAPVRAVARSTP